MRIFRFPSLPLKPKPAAPKRRDTIAPTVPRTFEFGLSSLRPLVPLNAASLLLNRNAKTILKLIEGGELRWAFDLRSPDTDHRQVRILRQSLLEHAGILDRPTEDETLPEEIELNRAIDLVLP